MSMTPDHATDLIRQTLMLALILAAPIVLVGFVAGLLVSLLQAVTQIQEQMLSFVPRIAATAAAAVVLTPWMGQRLIEYAGEMFIVM